MTVYVVDARSKIESRTVTLGIQTDADRRAAILRVIEPIAGEVQLERYEAVQDAHGNVIAYNAWVLR